MAANVIQFPSPPPLAEENKPQAPWKAEPVIAAKPARKPGAGSSELRVKKARKKPKRPELPPVPRLIVEYHNKFRINFPEVDGAKYEAALAAIPGCKITDLRPEWNKPGDPPAPPEKAVFLQIWEVAQSEESLQQVANFGRRYKFEFASDIAMRAWDSTQESKLLFKLSKAKTSDIVVPCYHKKEKYKKFQLAGIEYAARTERCFIADDMGAGKTVEGVGTMNYVNKWPWLVVCPRVAKSTWRDHCKAWMSRRRKIHVCTNQDFEFIHNGKRITGWTKCVNDTLKRKALRLAKEKLSQYDVVIVNYDKLGGWIQFLEIMKWVGVIFDESHFMKWSGAARYKLSHRLVEKVEPKYRLLLSGTPILNKAADLITQLNILDRLHEFGGSTHFESRYCQFVNVDPKMMLRARAERIEGVDYSEEDKLAKQMVDKVHENFIELNTRLRSLCYIRREKEEILTELPTKRRSTEKLGLTNRKEYTHAENDVIAYLMSIADKEVKFQKKIKGLTEEEKVIAIRNYRNEKAQKGARAQALARINATKLVAARGKLKAAKEWIDNFLLSGKKLVIFAHHRVIVERLMRAYPKAVVVRGGTTDAQRDAAVAAFQSTAKGSAQVFIGSLKAAGVALTLTAASDVVFLELGWTPALHDQAEDRTHRMGQRNAVTAHYLLAKNTIEERIAQLIEHKRGVVDATSMGDPMKSQSNGSILGDLVMSLTGVRVKL